MGRNVLIAKNVFDNLTESVTEAQFQFGLLIGQHCDSESSKDACVIHWCPTPGPEDSATPSSLRELHADLVAYHAAQVVHMLPGGISVLGAYVASPKATSSSAASSRAAQLRPLLTALYRVSLSAALNVKRLVQDKMLLLAVCSKTLQYTCESFSCSTSASFSEPVNVQMEADPGRWREVSFSYRLDLPLHLTAAQTSKQASLDAPLMQELRSWAGRVSTSCSIVVDGQLCRSDDQTPLQQHFPSDEVSPPPALSCRILEQCSEDTSSSGCAGATDVATTATLRGTMAGRAYLHHKCSVGGLVSGVMSDVYRSVHARWSLHSDSLLALEGHSSAHTSGLQQLPRRALVTVPELPILVSDYLFPGDTAEDACQSLEEVLGLSVSPHNVDQEVETGTTSISDDSSATSSISKNSVSASGRSSISAVFLQVAALLAVLAVLLAYLFFAR